MVQVAPGADGDDVSPASVHEAKQALMIGFAKHELNTVTVAPQDVAPSVPELRTVHRGAPPTMPSYEQLNVPNSGVAVPSQL